MPVHLTDVTLRDGLQIEPNVISVDDKLKLLALLVDCHYARLEITSFVSPKWIPQFGDALEFCEKLFAGPLAKKAEWMAFVPNEKGLERLHKFPIPWAAAFVAASEAFNKKNVNVSIDESLKNLSAVADAAKKRGTKLRVYVSTVFGCPYEGTIGPEKLEKVFRHIAQLQPDEIALGDTIGVAVPDQVRLVLAQVKSHFPLDRVALHFHNTYGAALSCAEAGYDFGVRKFDGSTGGIGGCPYAKGASGNAPTEEMAYAFFRQKRLPEFPSEALKATYVFLESLGLTLRSRLHEIWSRGGEWRTDL